jgi:hypothetical protein
MKKKVILNLSLLFCFCVSFAQNQFMPALPKNVKYEYSGSKDMHVGKVETDMYFVEISETTTLMCLKTNGIPNCLFTSNNYDGGCIYLELADKSYRKIIDCRKVDGLFKLFYIDENNEPDLIFTLEKKEDSSSSQALFIGYTLYWNNVSKK